MSGHKVVKPFAIKTFSKSSKLEEGGWVILQATLSAANQSCPLKG